MPLSVPYLSVQKDKLAVEKNRRSCVSMTQQTSGFVDKSGPYNFSV
jgi:hypothetical protein